MLIIQLGIFRCDPKNNRSRKMIPNLKRDGTVAFEKFSFHSIIWHQGPNANTDHYTCRRRAMSHAFCFLEEFGKWIKLLTTVV